MKQPPTEGIALIRVETYNMGIGTRFSYTPHKINPYTVIAVLTQIIEEIKKHNAQTERRNDDKPIQG